MISSLVRLLAASNLSVTGRMLVPSRASLVCLLGLVAERDGQRVFARNSVPSRVLTPSPEALSINEMVGLTLLESCDGLDKLIGWGDLG